MLVEDERVKLITFTGSGASAGSCGARAAQAGRLELGNATPVIVEADADLDDAAAQLAANAFSFAGQSCISVQRIYVERARYDELLGALPSAVEALVVGDPADEETDVGPLIDEDARDASSPGSRRREAGAEILTGGDLEGELLRPTVIANAGPDAEGLVRGGLRAGRAPSTAYGTLDEAIALANGTRYGLQAGIFTRDSDRAAGGAASSSSAASPSTRRRRSAPTRCPTAA